MRTRVNHRRTLLCSAAFGALSLTGTAWAQEEVDTEEDTVIQVIEEDEDVSRQEKIVVTGSRLARDEYNSISPVQVIQGETARAVGLISAEDILGSSSVNTGQRIDSSFNGFVLDGGPGSTEVNLRGLGSDRNLLLVNGRRLAPAGVEGAPSAGDIGLVPSILIGRIEQLLDGASSVYGADAVAGVINVILRDDLDGFEIAGDVTVPLAGGGNQTTISAAWGQSNDSGNIGFAAEFSSRDHVEFGDRRFTEECNRQIFIDPDSGEPVGGDCKTSLINRIFLPAGFGSIYYTPGTSNIGIPNYSESQAELTIDGSAVDFTDPFYNQAASRDAAKSDLLAPQDRYSIYSYGDYNLGLDTDTSVYFEAMYSNRQSTIDGGGGFFQFTVPGSNPYNPCNQTSNPDGVNCFGTIFGANLGDYNVFTINKIKGDRQFTDVEVAQTRFVAGVKGDLPIASNFGLNDWTYDASVQYSHSSGQSQREGILNDRMQLSLNTSYRDPVTGVVTCGIDLDGDGVPDQGNIGAFGDESLSTVPCVPINPFAPSIYQENGGTFATQAERDYVFGTRTFNTVVDQTIFQANIQGDLFDLPWNDAAVPVLLGFEYRDEGLDSRPDNVAREGLLNGFFADQGATGRRDLYEAFVETELPLLRGVKGAEELTLNVSGRWTEEENFGALWTYSAKAKYRPVEWLAFNATTGTSYRAPDLRDQFLRGSTGFNSFTDPCVVPNEARLDDDADLTTPPIYDATMDERTAQTLANCVTAGVDPLSLGIAQNLGPVQSLEVRSGGALDLQAEESESFTYGIQFEQPWSEAFDLKLGINYYDIEITDSIAEPSGTFIINDCYVNNPNLSSAFCSRLTRTGDFLTNVDTSQVNIGRETAKGFDFNMLYSQEFTFNERPLNIDFIVNANKTEERIVDLSNLLAPSATADDIAAAIDERVGEPANPEWRANATFLVGYRDFTAAWRTNYIHDGIADRDDLFDPTATNNPVDFTEPYTIHTVSLGYEADDWGVRFGLENVFDETPPAVDTAGVFGIRNVPLGIGYDLLGRRAFVSATKTF